MKMPEGENPYQVLGIERDATEAEIKRAYFALVRGHPPERDPEGFKRIRAAYEKLRVSHERVETDLFLVEDEPVTLQPSTIRRFDAEPPVITPAMLKSDLLVLESLLLLEELK